MSPLAYERSDFLETYRTRREAAALALAEAEVEVLLLTLGAELPWLMGYEAMPLERITALVLRANGDATLVVPALEAPRVRQVPGVEVLPWRDGDDPFIRLAELLPYGARVATSDRTWAGWLLSLQRLRSDLRFSSATPILVPLRRRKDALEVELLEAAGAAADRVALQLQSGEIPVIGRSEREVSRAIADALIAEGHSRVNFSIVASGPNAASPHHAAGSRSIEPGDSLVCDFGGVFEVGGEPGYCSDTTRTFAVGFIPPGFEELYSVLHHAQEYAATKIVPGMSGRDADGLARKIIADAGYGEAFIHRLGHGIGLEEHEDPYLSLDSDVSLEIGDAFSIEPGIYVEGSMGARIEDIGVLEIDGVRRLNQSSRELLVLHR
ncbi:MAG: M24 family metallopeptidase [Ferrimicrobium sp.]